MQYITPFNKNTLTNTCNIIKKALYCTFKLKFMNLVQVGETIKQRRQRLDIRQNDLADLAEVGLRTLIAIENGTGNPSFETLTKIVDVLGLELTLTIKS